jgi:GAF domain-containing protein
MPRRLDLVLRNTDRVYPLQPEQTLTAGRTPQCDVQLDDPSVSRRHCTITLLANGLLRVKDLESANGTFVNERPITDATARAGDLIRLGAAILEVRDPSGIMQRPDQTVFTDESTVESVIQKRIEPSDFGWLKSPGEGPAPELALLKRAQRHLSTLHRVSELLAGARDTTTLSDATLRGILEVLPADRGAIVLRRHDADGEAEVLAARSKTQAAIRFTVSRTLVADVMARGISVFAHDASSDIRFADGQSVIGQRVRSVMCVPLRTTDEILGALYVDSLSGAGKFTEADLELLAAIGNQAGVAMHRVRLLGELERLLLDTIKAIAATIDARDGYTHRHSERVAALTGQLARELGLSDAERETAELSGGAVGAAPRRRQDRGARLDPEQAGQADAGGVRRDAETPGARRAHPRQHPERDGQGRAPRRAVPPREVGRQRLSRGAARGEHPVSRPAPRRRRLLRCADVDALLPRRDVGRGGDRARRQGLRHALRSRRRRGAAPHPRPR